MIDPAGIPSFRTADWKFRLIDGRYRVARVLARTDTTAVLVVDDADDVERVLKVVRHDGDDARFLQVIREFDIVRSIEHSGVVRAHRVFELDEHHAAIVMNRAPGRNLQTLMRSRQSLEVEDDLMEEPTSIYGQGREPATDEDPVNSRRRETKSRSDLGWPQSKPPAQVDAAGPYHGKYGRCVGGRNDRAQQQPERQHRVPQPHADAAVAVVDDQLVLHR